MYQVCMKVYGAFHPAPEAVDAALISLQPQIIGDSPWFYRTNDMIAISYEGIWFPVDDALELLTQVLPPEATGKMDVLDLDAWTLTRHQWVGEATEPGENMNVGSAEDSRGTERTEEIEEIKVGAEKVERHIAKTSNKQDGGNENNTKGAEEKKAQRGPRGYFRSSPARDLNSVLDYAGH